MVKAKAKKGRYQNLLMKTKKIIKQALKQPELYSEAELAYLRPVKRARKAAKQAKKVRQDDENA